MHNCIYVNNRTLSWVDYMVPYEPRGVSALRSSSGRDDFDLPRQGPCVCGVVVIYVVCGCGRGGEWQWSYPGHGTPPLPRLDPSSSKFPGFSPHISTGNGPVVRFVLRNICVLRFALRVDGLGGFIPLFAPISCWSRESVHLNIGVRYAGARQGV